MKRKICILFLLTLSTMLLLTSCNMLSDITHQKETEAEQQKTIANSDIPKDILEKGYDLPVDEKIKSKAESDCKKAMETIQKEYQQLKKNPAEEVIIHSTDTEKAVEQMMETLSALDAPILAEEFYCNMLNYEKMEDFLNQVQNGKKTKIVTYELHLDMGIGRREFTFDGEELYVLYTSASWNETGNPVITTTTYTRIKEWQYTQKGWFAYELCVPEPPEVTEIFNGNVMTRVAPREEESRDIMLRYLLPLGYQGNNLLCSNWDIHDLKDLDYNGLFEALYIMEYQKSLPLKQYSQGIPKEEFENLIMKYLPVTVEELEKYAVFDSEQKVYLWARSGCGNYVPQEFGTSIPEITKIKENADGTTTLTVDAVCEMLGTDALFSHELTLRFLQDGRVEYLGNRIIGDGLEKIPEYQYRLETKDYSEIFQSLRGCAVILDSEHQTYTLYHKEECNNRVSPLSTFKIVSTLTGLHHQVLTSENSKMEYNGENYPVSSWNTDLNLAEAFQTSCVWYFRKVLDTVGREEVNREIQALNYGNCDISEWKGNHSNSFSELNGFWLESSLLISPLEQVRILQDIFEGNTIYDQDEIEILKKIMLIKSDDTEKIYGKTGSGTNHNAWFVGVVEKENGNIYFAVYLNDNTSEEINGTRAKNIALNLVAND